ncbi:MAG: hypothetical protein ACRBN8_31125 [Nannocystales bacterium]
MLTASLVLASSFLAAAPAGSPEDAAPSCSLVPVRSFSVLPREGGATDAIVIVAAEEGRPSPATATVDVADDAGTLASIELDKPVPAQIFEFGSAPKAGVAPIVVESATGSIEFEVELPPGPIEGRFEAQRLGPAKEFLGKWRVELLARRGFEGASPVFSVVVSAARPELVEGLTVRLGEQSSSGGEAGVRFAGRDKTKRRRRKCDFRNSDIVTINIYVSGNDRLWTGNTSTAAAAAGPGLEAVGGEACEGPGAKKSGSGRRRYRRHHSLIDRSHAN